MEKMMKRYEEVNFDTVIPDKDDTFPKNRLLQYEYALYVIISQRFYSISNKCFGIDSLKLYFQELPGTTNTQKAGRHRVTQADILEKVECMADKDVFEHIRFPQMSSCKATIRVLPRTDGTHVFLFSDGTYAFAVSFILSDKRKPKKIEVRNFRVTGH